MIGVCLPLFSQTQKLFRRETNLFTNSKDLNDLKTTFKIKRIHGSYLENFRKAMASSTWITNTRSLGFSSFKERN
jgi:hypothetical protein